MEDAPPIHLGNIQQRDPSSDRQKEFNRGWNAAVKELNASNKTPKYPEASPSESPTWDDLGYRLGSLFGETDDNLRQELFEWCIKKRNREIQRREPSKGREQTTVSDTEEIETPYMSDSECAYCPHSFKYITIPEKDANKLIDDSIPPTYIEIECPQCENVFYYTQRNWDSSFDSSALETKVEKRKTSPGKNLYIPKKNVTKIE
jgi:phage FluMu protein Com